MMNGPEAIAVVERAIDYMLLIRESSGADDGELDLARDLERVIEFVRSREAKK